MENEREIESDIEKTHYKFYYKPVTNTKAEKEYILLDILYEESHYGNHTAEIDIDSIFTKSEEENLIVAAPIPEAILGDKLTAFAPNTTGVPYNRGKEVEVIKQLFDVGHLFDMVEDMEIVSTVFNQFATTELSYRGMKSFTLEDVLNDIFETAKVIATRGKSGDGNFAELHKGIQNIKNYIFSENFHIERAMIPTAKAAYISAILQTGTNEIERFTNPRKLTDWIIEQPFETRLNKLKRSNLEAFFYWFKAYKLFQIHEKL